MFRLISCLVCLVCAFSILSHVRAEIVTVPKGSLRPAKVNAPGSGQGNTNTAAAGAPTVPIFHPRIADPKGMEKEEYWNPNGKPVVGEGKFSKRHSFFPPYDPLAIPYWSLGAGAKVEVAGSMDSIGNHSFVRITPARQARTGYIWNERVSTMSDWAVQFSFHVSGRPNYGGDGFAFWYVEKPELLGSVYGSTDYWNGLLVAFDTYDNDQQGSTPLISAVFNDGNIKYDANTDGASQALASCTFDIRNLPDLAHARIIYSNYTLTINIAVTHDANGHPIWTPCLQVEEVDLGVDKYFGLSAHTGDVADNHDVYDFLVKDLSPDDVDLDALRTKYNTDLKEYHKEHDWEEMSTADFQHEVLSTLSQIQGELNMLELGQVALSDYIHLKDDALAILDKASQATQAVNAAAEAAAAGKAPTPGSGAATSNAGSSGSSGDTQAQLKAIKVMLESQQSVQNKVEALSKLLAQVSTTVQGLNSGSAAGAGSAAGSAAGGDLAASLTSVDGTVRLIRDSVQTTLPRKLDDLNNALQTLSKSNNNLQTNLDRLITFANTQQTNMAKVLSEISFIKEKLASGASSSSSSSGYDSGVHSAALHAAAAASAGSWTIHGLLFFCAACIAVLTFYTFQQHRQKDRYKLI